MTATHEKTQEGILAQIHWTAAASFSGGLFLVALSTFGAAVNESTPMGRDFWDSVSRMHLGLVFSAVILAGIVYALTGWIFGLVALGIARRPAWRKGFALATVGLGLAVFFCVALLLLALLYLASPCMSADACHISNQQHH